MPLMQNHCMILPKIGSNMRTWASSPYFYSHNAEITVAITLAWALH